MERDEEVALVSLGIQGIDQRSSKSTVFGKKIPGSDRTIFLQYNFTAKLGIDGSAVDIQDIDENANEYRITIPEFTFIGYSEPVFKLAAEDTGVLGWVTPDIDQAEMISQILNADDQREYIEQNEDILEDQAEFFYSSIVHSISPDAEIEFQFADSSTTN